MLFPSSAIDFGGDESAKPKDKINNEAMLTRMADAVHGHVLAVNKAVEIMSQLRTRSVNPVTKMRSAQQSLVDIVPYFADFRTLAGCPFFCVAVTAFQISLPCVHSCSSPVGLMCASSSLVA